MISFKQFTAIIAVGIMMLVPFSLPYSEEIWTPNNSYSLKIDKSENFKEYLWFDYEFEKMSFDQIQKMEIDQVWIGKQGTVAYLSGNKFFVTSDYYKELASLAVEQTANGRIVLHHGMHWYYISLLISVWFIVFLARLSRSYRENLYQEIKKVK